MKNVMLKRLAILGAILSGTNALANHEFVCVSSYNEVRNLNIASFFEDEVRLPIDGELVTVGQCERSSIEMTQPVQGQSNKVSCAFKKSSISLREYRLDLELISDEEDRLWLKGKIAQTYRRPGAVVCRLDTHHNESSQDHEDFEAH